MVNDPKEIYLKLKSLRTEYEELKKEIEVIHREIQSKHEKGKDIGALIKIEKEKLDRTYSLLKEFSQLINKGIGK